MLPTGRYLYDFPEYQPEPHPQYDVQISYGVVVEHFGSIEVAGTDNSYDSGYRALRANIAAIFAFFSMQVPPAKGYICHK